MRLWSGPHIKSSGALASEALCVSSTGEER